MTDKLRGAFHGCPHHGDDYEACIQYSGTAPCGVMGERDEYHSHLTVIAEMTGDEGDIGAAWEAVNALQEALAASEKREQALAARCTEVEQLRDLYRADARDLHWRAANAGSARDNALAERDTAEVERGRFSRMFAQACETLGAVQDALGNSDEPEGIGLEPELVRGLMAERDALAAHVERLREALWKIADTSNAIKCRELAGDAYDETPATSLARLIAEKQMKLLDERALAREIVQAVSVNPDSIGGARVARKIAAVIRRQAEEAAQ